MQPPKPFYCPVCLEEYDTQREADLCTPADFIEWRYGEKAVSPDESDFLYFLLTSD